MLVRVLSVALIGALFAGCVSGYTYAPRWGQNETRFKADLGACDDPSGTYIAPLILMPVMLMAVVALKERTRRCMEARGWRVVGETSWKDQPPGPDPDPEVLALPGRSEPVH